MTMLKICVAIDAYKLAIFKRRLAEAGYAFEEGPGLTIETLHLYVRATSVIALEKIVRAANEEARKTR